jgi:glycosyltransferase involved in cell wall biosynthesis
VLRPVAGEVILDVSRLLSRVRHATPSGVDRVEMAYARGLCAVYGPRLQFAAVHPFGIYGRVPRSRMLRYLDSLEQRWSDGQPRSQKRSIAAVLPTLVGLLPRPVRGGGGGVYVQASPHHLVKPALVRRILKREQAQFLCMVHDLIPIEYPEYARPNGARLHQQRVQTIAAMADAIIVNSSATGDSLKPWLAKVGRHIDVRVALLGTLDIPLPPGPSPSSDSPYFLCVGTIEPRKNHLLLLNLWRRLADTRPAGSMPRLVIVGRRGWENEQVVDMLERCQALRGHVEELNGCSDVDLHDLLRGARALLLPSFAEGYGMPVAEALSVGTPVICSDLPALREAGGSVPDFLDPLDGPAWHTYILDHFERGPRHLAQALRLPAWSAPSWHDHIQIVVSAIEDLRARASAHV